MLYRIPKSRKRAPIKYPFPCAYFIYDFHRHLAVNAVDFLNTFKKIMDTSFVRVQSIINRLREILKCQKCLQMKEENSMLFYHVCDHFYCIDCLSETNKPCPLCKNPLDKPSNVLHDKNILALYQSLSKFELPSKQDIEKVYKSHKESKQEVLNESSKQLSNQQAQIQETPTNHGKSRLKLKEKENKKNTSITSVEGTETITVSSGEGNSNNESKAENVTPQSVSTKRRGRRTKTPTKSRCNTAVSTPARRGRTVTPQRFLGNQDVSPIRPSTGTSKKNASFTKTNVNKRNPKGETQLHLACKRNNFTAMTELIAAGANINAQDNAGWTPLHDSVFSGNVEVIKFLLDNGARVNAPGLENTTALHEAIAKGNAKIVKLLLDYGADVNAKNIFKETPLDLVNKYKLEEMKEVLLQASSNVKTSETVTAQETEQELIIYKFNLSIEDEKAVNKFVEKFQGETISSLTSKVLPSHIVVSEGFIQLTWDMISSVPKGCRVVTIRWVKDSLKENVLKPSGDYESSSALFSGFPKARANKLNQLPGLFSGCHFFFGGNFEHYVIKSLTIGKENLKLLVEKNGGVIVKRCPDPESLALEKTIPFHASATSSLRETAYFIIYQTDKWDPKPKYNMSHMKTLPVEWLVCCILKFELIDPNQKELWSNCF